MAPARVGLLALLVLTGLVGGSCGAQVPSQTPGAAAAPAVTPDLQSALAGLGLPLPSGASLVVEPARSRGEWMVLAAGASAGNPSHPATDLTVVIGHRVNGAWHLVSERDTGAFCGALAAAPTGLVSADVRAYFVGCH